ncbi:uncharacterized protein BJ212DRAFT_1303899 [Suillus subaureus]|uniref:Uncharacterized protein n=1 Tax=Suillus subaureus TaxID=48587 RepID=A0A9P7DXL8_9AGAM|nr:uncharacterized protein BJ212DRAFT_1303899 [Suillus subaureus]KAG1805837.1 hypothetical protein BJ212DRAFT_1303899 [Suillus subaureus]
MLKLRSLSMGRTGLAHPSPLSRLTGQCWREDEDDGGKEYEDNEASPSPESTDTNGKGHSVHDSECSTRPWKVRSASKSSHLVKQASHSSICTVTAGSVCKQEQDTGLIHHDEDALQADVESDDYQAWCGMTES